MHAAGAIRSRFIANCLMVIEIGFVFLILARVEKVGSDGVGKVGLRTLIMAAFAMS